MFDNATLLITGGTGSFGQAVLRKFLSTDKAVYLINAMASPRR